jgi:hypothetical protein
MQRCSNQKHDTSIKTNVNQQNKTESQQVSHSFMATDFFGEKTVFVVSENGKLYICMHRNETRPLSFTSSKDQPKKT